MKRRILTDRDGPDRDRASRRADLARRRRSSRGSARRSARGVRRGARRPRRRLHRRAALPRARRASGAPVGKVDDFKIGETVNVDFVDASPLPWAGVTAKTAAWLRRVSDDGVRRLLGQLRAPRLSRSAGCADARLFMCPCHGGVYYEDGTRRRRPPPHALPQYPVRVHDGEVEIRTDPIPIG